MEVRVLRSGMLSTVQDLGRPGLRAAGVPVGGAMDAFALRVANLLVGNEENAAGLEMTRVGAELELGEDAVVAVTGANAGGLAPWRPHLLKAGARIQWGQFTAGCRAYLAVAGGFDVPEVLDGRGTYLRAGWGGWQGRALRNGDILTIAPTGRTLVAGNWHIDPRILPAYAPSPTLRVLKGAQAGEFNPQWLQTDFEVHPQSDRMGIRLAGAPLVRAVATELESTAVAPGTVQVPPDGQPIVLAADAQTIGGYPQLAHVISVDLPLLAQLRPGDRVRFAEVSLAEAHRLFRAREHALALLREGLIQKRR
jgi:antagonist of KipI